MRTHLPSTESADSLPSMATVARPGGSQDPGLLSALSYGCRNPVLGLFSSAFNGALGWSWIRSGEVEQLNVKPELIYWRLYLLLVDQQLIPLFSKAS